MKAIIESGNDFNNKSITLLRIRELNNTLFKSVKFLNELNDKSNDNKINNLMKMFRISVSSMTGCIGSNRKITLWSNRFDRY